MRFPKVVLHLPVWVESFIADSQRIFPTVEERMQLAVTLSQLNVKYKTGGPFGAGIFEQPTGRLVAPGVNQVESANCSVAHAEVLAITIAQHIVGHYDLASDDGTAYELVTSTEPCAMCLGAVSWSGLRRVVCGAREEDARNIGFDEGPKPQDWVRSLESRGIIVLRDVLREPAKAVLIEYQKQGGLIYNPGRKNPAQENNS